MVAFGVIHLLWTNGAGGHSGFGPTTSLPAPQADALVGVIETIRNGNVPVDKFFLGGLAGLVMGLAPISGMGVLVGLAIYLPFSITLTYGLGCLTQMWLEKSRGKAFYEGRLVPLAAGLIIGEALLSVGVSFFEILQGAGG